MTRPYFASEKLLAGPPYRGCGVSSLWHLYALATDNETALTDARRLKTTVQRRADLQRGWKAFATQRPADSNGWADQGDTRLIAEAMFPKLPKPFEFNPADFSQVIDKLDAGYAFSLALRLTALRASSKLRRYTSADHQCVIWDRKRDEVMLIDPMHPQSDAYAGIWVPLADVRTASLAIGNGIVIASMAPIGGWTQEELAGPFLRSKLADALDLNKRLRDRLRESAADCSEPLAVQREAFADRLHDLETEVRSA